MDLTTLLANDVSKGISRIYRVNIPLIIILMDLYLYQVILLYAKSTLLKSILSNVEFEQKIEQKNNDLKVRARTIYDFLLAKTKRDDYRLQPVKRSC